MSCFFKIIFKWQILLVLGPKRQSICWFAVDMQCARHTHGQPLTRTECTWIEVNRCVFFFFVRLLLSHSTDIVADRPSLCRSITYAKHLTRALSLACLFLSHERQTHTWHNLFMGLNCNCPAPKQSKNRNKVITNKMQINYIPAVNKMLNYRRLCLDMDFDQLMDMVCHIH